MIWLAFSSGFFTGVVTIIGAALYVARREGL